MSNQFDPLPVFEVKAYSGQIRNTRDKWQKKGRFEWYSLSVNPGKQARRNPLNFKEFFSENDIALNMDQSSGFMGWANNSL